MVNFNWEYLLSIPQLCESSFRIALSDLGVIRSFAYDFACRIRDAVDEGAIGVESVQAGGAGGATSWLVVVDHNERVPAADVLPTLRIRAEPIWKDLHIGTVYTQ